MKQRANIAGDQLLFPPSSVVFWQSIRAPVYVFDAFYENRRKHHASLQYSLHRMFASKKIKNHKYIQASTSTIHSSRKTFDKRNNFIYACLPQPRLPENCGPCHPCLSAFCPSGSFTAKCLRSFVTRSKVHMPRTFFMHFTTRPHNRTPCLPSHAWMISASLEIEGVWQATQEMETTTALSNMETDALPGCIPALGSK